MRSSQSCPWTCLGRSTQKSFPSTPTTSMLCQGSFVARPSTIWVTMRECNRRRYPQKVCLFGASECKGDPLWHWCWQARFFLVGRCGDQTQGQVAKLDIPPQKWWSATRWQRSGLAACREAQKTHSMQELYNSTKEKLKRSRGSLAPSCHRQSARPCRQAAFA